MNLKNYTTKISASNSIHAIEKLLIDFGAIGIMKEYSSTKAIVGINFILNINGFKMPFKLPAKIQETYVWLRKQKRKPPEKELLAQAERVCWKQMHEWVYLQLSLIELEQAEPLEVFFPYLSDGQQTFYQKIKGNNFKALLPSAT